MPAVFQFTLEFLPPFFLQAPLPSLALLIAGGWRLASSSTESQEMSINLEPTSLLEKLKAGDSTTWSEFILNEAMVKQLSPVLDPTGASATLAAGYLWN